VCSSDLKFLARVAVPVVVTPMAKGLIPPDHPCYVGVLFHALSDRLKRITESADLIIGIGYDPVEYNYESWMPDVPVVHFATSNVDMPDSVRAVQVIGPPDSWFDALGRSAIEGDFLSGRGVTGVRQEINEIFRECSGKWGPVAVLKTLREELPAGSVIACDVGSHLHMAGQYWDVYEPGRLIMTNGWSTMGFGLPAAMAASLNKPGTTVAAVTGDGGFLMSAGEIMTARRYNLNVKIIVISDRELNLISVKQSWKDLDPYGTRLMDGNLFDANRFLGVPVLNATSYVSMRKCIGSALNTAGPVIINASVDSADYQRIITRQ
jgi:acetolactate synthase-1/2/3 large subunit